MGQTEIRRELAKHRPAQNLRYLVGGSKTKSSSGIGGRIPDHFEFKRSVFESSHGCSPAVIASCRDIRFDTIGKALAADETSYQAADYIGPERSRQMRNAVIASVLEYLSG
jgi:hypothetical protein